MQCSIVRRGMRRRAKAHCCSASRVTTRNSAICNSPIPCSHLLLPLHCVFRKSPPVSATSESLEMRCALHTILQQSHANERGTAKLSFFRFSHVGAGTALPHKARSISHTVLRDIHDHRTVYAGSTLGGSVVCRDVSEKNCRHDLPY